MKCPPQNIEQPTSMRWLRRLAVRVCRALLWTALPASPPALAAAENAAPLPAGVRAVWDLTPAYRQSTETRERVCLNGLWAWQPAGTTLDTVPENGWGFFKVPGAWPGITDYLQKDCQTVYRHPQWARTQLKDVRAAWYEREIVVPPTWEGRRVTLDLQGLNSLAFVYLDRQKAGEIRFPGGELELTPLCQPGRSQRLSLLVAALPLQGVMLSYSDTASARTVPGAVARRGVCGDTFLQSGPRGPRLTDVRIETSVRRREACFDAGLADLEAERRYLLRAKISQPGRPIAEFRSESFAGKEAAAGRRTFAAAWLPERLWDLHTPEATYRLDLALLDAQGNLLDTSEPERFGFREFWIDGRDFYLNGTRLFLSAVPLDNAQVGAAWATYAAARESLDRLKSIGINFVYTHNYGCEPGAHLGFGEILRAADDLGMLVSFSQPHFGQYDWRAPESDQTNGYAHHARAYTRMAGNHPSVVCYSMSHNATGYSEDMNPDLIDGLQAPRDTWALNNAKLALRAEAIVNRLDPGRLVYHHASGNLGTLHAINFYPNFVPAQELSDWFEHWATRGVKPVFLCEYGAPFTWDWTLYRGWFQGQREFGSAKVPWEFCVAEWNAQFLGDRAFRLGAPEKANLRWEAKQYRAGNLWHRWDYPFPVGSPRFTDRYDVLAAYITDNWRAFRTWGVSAFSPWEYEHYWVLRDGVSRRRVELPVDWDRLQRPGFSADYLDQRPERMDLAFERTDWQPSAAAEALLRHNRPLLGYLAGKPSAFTSKDHLFYPGEPLEKEVVVINNSRQPVSVRCDWSVDLPDPIVGRRDFDLPSGEQRRLPVRFGLPAHLPPGAHTLTARMRFNTGENQEDSIRFHVLARPSPAPTQPRIALFDPKGESAAWLRRCGLHCQSVDAKADLKPFDLLVVGKGALSAEAPAPDLARVRDGLQVLVFEQSAAALEKRFGFRTVEYGLRWVFPRVPDHPLLAGLNAELLRDWRGEATLTSPRLDYELRPRHGPTVSWCGLPVTRAWRCGNRGNVASVLIEKPARGDFLPVVDGGFGLRYSPLLVYREGRGAVVFCQMDVTGRTDADPAAETLTVNLFRWLAQRKPQPQRTVLYAGGEEGQRHIEALGFDVSPYPGTPLAADRVLVVAPGHSLRGHADTLKPWLQAGGPLFALGLTESEANGFLPFAISAPLAEYISAPFTSPGIDSPLAGLGPADLHNRDPRLLPLVTAGARPEAGGALAVADPGPLVFCALAPWTFQTATNSSVKRTFRNTSFALTRLLANQGARGSTPLLARFGTPAAATERRWLQGFYLDTPEEWDDPYRFFRW